MSQVEEVQVKAKQTAEKPKSAEKTQRVIVFVCTGNTCRSPMAEQLLKHHLAERGLDEAVRVESRGLMATGLDMNDFAKEALKTLGLKATAHTSRMLETTLCKEAFMIVCMEDFHKGFIMGEIGEQENIKTAGEITMNGNIPDPYGQSLEAYEATAKKLDELCQKLIEYL